MTLRNSSENLAVSSKQDQQIAALGAAGASPPAIVGSGIIGWLRGLFERAQSVEAKIPALDVRGRMPVGTVPDDSHNFASYFSMQRGSTTVDRATGRLRITIEAGTLPVITTVSTVNAVTTVGNQTSIGGVNATPMVRAAMNSAWALAEQRIYS